MTFARFMSTTTGRATRVGAGFVSIVGGLLLGGVAGWAIAAVGLIPLAAGATNVCLLAPLFHLPFRGDHHPA